MDRLGLRITMNGVGNPGGSFFFKRPPFDNYTDHIAHEVSTLEKKERKTKERIDVGEGDRPETGQSASRT